MNELLNAALEYAKHGWYVLPCVPNEKRPATKHGVYDATADEQQIREWWETNPFYNVAVACGEKSGITVVDIDDNCEEWLAKLPKTLTQKTPSGGYHVFFAYYAGIHNAVHLYPGIDVRNNGGYVLVQPSCVECGTYSWDDDLGNSNRDLALFPKDLLIPKQGRQVYLQSTSNSLPASPPNQLERASLYLAECDPAVQGCGGHNKLLYAADRMVNGFLLTDEQAYDILAKEFNPHCIPPWDLANEQDAKDFCRKIDEARKLKGQHEPGWLLGTGLESKNVLPEFVGRCRLLLPDTTRAACPATATREYDYTTSNTIPENLCGPPGLLGDICQWMNETALIPQPLLSLAATLTFLGSLLGRKVQDTLGSRTNLYCMGVAPSSAGKNHAITCIRNLVAEALCTPILGGEYVASDAAIEERICRNPTTLFLWDEIGYLLTHIRSGLSKNHAQVVSVLMKLYSSANSIYLGREYAEKDKQRIIIQPCCCIYGTATPESFSSGLSPEQLQDGWLSRCLVFYSNTRPDKQRNIYNRSDIPTSIVEQVKQWYTWQPERLAVSEMAKFVLPGSNTYQEAPPQQIIIPETSEASQVFIDFDNETIKQGDRNPQLACLWKKGEENARRIALICACSGHFDDPIISEHTASYSCSLVRYLLESFVANIAPEITSNEIERRKRKIMKIIMDAKSKGVTRAELTKRTRWATNNDRSKLVEDLMQTEEVIFGPSEDGGMRFFLK